jgi:hypothetical protein
MFRDRVVEFSALALFAVVVAIIAYVPDGCDQVAIIAGVAAHGMTTPRG